MEFLNNRLALTTLLGNSSKQTFMDVSSSSNKTWLEGWKGPLVIVDMTVSILAIFVNIVVLQAVTHVRLDLTGYRRFLISLTVSDLYIACVNVANFICQSEIFGSRCFTIIRCSIDLLRNLQLVGFFANLLNLVGMTLDHLVGIAYPLRYTDFLNKNAVRIAVCGIWIIAVILGFLDIPIGAANYFIQYNGDTNDNIGDTVYDYMNEYLKDVPDLNMTSPESSSSLSELNVDYDLMSEDEGYNNSAPLELGPRGGAAYLFGRNDHYAGSNSTSNSSMTPEELEIFGRLLSPPKEKDDPFCVSYSAGKTTLEYLVMSLVVITLVILVLVYWRIFREVSSSNSAAESGTRRLVVTTCLLLGAFIACWMPFMSFELSMITIMKALSTFSNISEKPAILYKILGVNNFLHTVLMCYPLVDPIIYAARMRILRRWILIHYGHFLPCFRKWAEAAVQREKAHSFSRFASTGQSGPNGSRQGKDGRSGSVGQSIRRGSGTSSVGNGTRTFSMGSSAADSFTINKLYNQHYNSNGVTFVSDTIRLGHFDTVVEAQEDQTNSNRNSRHGNEKIELNGLGSKESSSEFQPLALLVIPLISGSSTPSGTPSSSSSDSSVISTITPPSLRCVEDNIEGNFDDDPMSRSGYRGLLRNSSTISSDIPMMDSGSFIFYESQSRAIAGY